jgi:4-hydroxy-3-methylbut-2-enyl diphosphate reductase
MKLTFAKNIGFCSGVKRAIFIAKTSLKEDPKPIYFLGKIVHNEKVIESFEKDGVKFISDPKEAKQGTLIIQAHGFPPFSPQKGVRIRDATCPLVKKVQTIAKQFLKRGYKVIIIGEKNHPEVKGIQGAIKNKGIVVENEKDAKKLEKFEKIGAVSQTTQEEGKVKKILKILKKKAKEIEFVNTICPEVQKRQKELKEILKKADAILVIGSKLSANTTRLFEIAKESKKKVFWVNDLKELKKEDLKKIKNLGIVSGTSAPDWEIEKIKNWLKNYD